MNEQNIIDAQEKIEHNENNLKRVISQIEDKGKIEVNKEVIESFSIGATKYNPRVILSVTEVVNGMELVGKVAVIPLKSIVSKEKVDNTVSDNKFLDEDTIKSKYGISNINNIWDMFTVMVDNTVIINHIPKLEFKVDNLTDTNTISNYMVGGIDGLDSAKLSVELDVN